MTRGQQVSLEFQNLADQLMHDKDGLKDFIKDNRKEAPHIVKEIKVLELMLLQYMFVHDDGKVSLNEKLKLKKYYFEYRKILSKEDMEFLNANLHGERILENIKQFINDNDVKSSMITHLISQFTKKHILGKKYALIAEQLQKLLKD